MNMKIVLTNLFLLVATFSYSNQTDSLLKVLDFSIKKREMYFSEKENNLSDLKKMLGNSNSKTDQFYASQKLMREYSYFINDSALHYSKIAFELATDLNNKDFITETILEKAQILSNSELFHESFSIMQSIDSSQVPDFHKAQYYKNYIIIYHNQIKDIKDSYYQEKYKKELRKHINSYLSYKEKNSLEYQTVLAYKYYIDGMTSEAVSAINEILSNPEITPYIYAEFLCYQGRILMESGKEHWSEAKYYLVQAAIEYNKLAVTQNPSMIYLSIILLEEKDLKRAYDYIDIAVENNNKFNNNHNHHFTEKTHSLIKNTYYNQIEEQQKVLQYYSILLTFFFIVTILALILIFQRKRILKKTRSDLSKAILKLQETNKLKKAYIGHYLDQYFTYMIKLNDYRRYIIKKINSGKYDEIIDLETKALIKEQGDINILFSDFDKTFLSLYPNFIQSVNLLLSEGNQFVLNYNKKDNTPRMNTEIRIMALLKLGISDNKKIASFLRVSIQTIYNYRSKMKAKAINEDTFEDEIKMIHTIEL